MIEQSNADNIPDLKPCPFCGRRAAYMGYDLRDPISGKTRQRIMIGCPAAFTARGDWGDGHKTCPVAPMIDSWAAPAGTDIVAAWNRRAEDLPADCIDGDPDLLARKATEQEINEGKAVWCEVCRNEDCLQQGSDTLVMCRIFKHKSLED
jgi:hypothetical protein